MVICLNTKDENGKQPPQQDRLYSTEGVMTAITSGLGGRFNILEKKILIKQATKEGYAECECGGIADLSFPSSETRRGAGAGQRENVSDDNGRSEWIMQDRGFI